MKIKFLRKFKPAGDAPDIPTYKAGEVYDLADGYAKKYVARGLAVEHKNESAPVVTAYEPPKVEEVVEPPTPELVELPTEFKPVRVGYGQPVKGKKHYR